MKAVDIEQILPFEQWERLRPILRPLFVREKERRRLAVGEHITLLFENAQSVWYQVEEMVRVERILDRAAVRHELDTYNELIPREDELSATLLIEYPDPAQRDQALKELVGLERHLWLHAGEKKIAATFSDTQFSTEQISAVQFVRFALPRGLGSRFVELAQAGRLAIEIDHPSMQAVAKIDPALAEALFQDSR
jgi:hypothetical protein